MIIHRLMLQHMRNRDDAGFYNLQSRDAVHWMRKWGFRPGPDVHALDLGAGHGLLGLELKRQGCLVTFADESNQLLPELQGSPFHQINLDRDSPATLGQYDLLVCSNVLEHLTHPKELVQVLPDLLKTGGHFFLSWTNWLSPWGGHEFSPFHFLGTKRGPALFDKLIGRPRKHNPYENLFPTYIGQTLGWIRSVEGLQVQKVAPRYYPELRFITAIPVLREFVCWNCVIWGKKKQ